MIWRELINLSQILPLYLPDQPEQRPNHSATPYAVQTHAETIQLLHMNVFRFNTDHNKMVAHIRQVQPDIISLAEFNEGWIRAMKDNATLNAFPYHLTDPQSRIALFSKWPLEQLKRYPLSSPWDAVYVADFKLADELVRLMLIHPKPPVFPSIVASHHEHRALVRELIVEGQREGIRHWLIMGDMNMTSWSVLFQQMLRETQTRDSRKGFGLQASWPIQSPLMMIPIDHCLVSSGLQVIQRSLGPSVGSDHRPVAIELGLQPEND